MTLTQRINGFAKVWPNVIFGPASIIFDNHMLDKASIDYSVYITECVLGLQNPGLLDVVLVNYIKNSKKHSVAELQATLKFIKQLQIQ
jgi:hypothetical protein